MAFDLVRPPDLWLPPKPAIVRATALPKPRAASFCGPFFCPPVMTKVTPQDAVLNTGSVASVTLPTVKTGDIAVLFIRWIASGGSSSVTPASGWTQIDMQAPGSSGFHGNAAWYRVLTAADSGASVAPSASSQTNGSSSFRYDVLIFRPDVPARGVTVGDVEFNGTTGNPAAQTINASGQTTPSVILFGCTMGSSAKPTQSGTLVDNGNTWDSAVEQGAYLVYNSGTPSDLTYDANDSGSATSLMTFWMKITP